MTDKVIWHLYNATALDIDFDSDLEDEHLEESLEDDLEQEENKGKKEKRDRLHGLIPDVKDATSLQAITVALTGFEKLLLTTANKIEINMTPAVIKLTNITTDADINADGNAVDDGKYLFLPMKMLGVKMGQITLLLEPALDALLGLSLFIYFSLSKKSSIFYFPFSKKKKGTSSTNEIQKLGLLTGIECIIRAADRIVSPLQSQARHLHNVPFSLPFIILRANIENLQTRLDDEWWNRWYRYNSGRRKYNGLTNEMAGAGSGRRRAGQNQGGRRGGCLNI